MSTFFIPGHVPSSKNNRQIGKRLNPKWLKKEPAVFKDGEWVEHSKFIPVLVSSKRVRNYVSNSLQSWLNHANKFKNETKNIKKPIYLGFYFHRESRHRFDFPNAVQVLLDCMSGHYYNTKKFKELPPSLFWIPDDNMEEIMPIPLGFDYRPDRPGVTITIIPEWLVEMLQQEVPKREGVLF